MKRLLTMVAAAATIVFAGAAHAGPFILAGTDADDHGSTSGGANIDGWFFMQRSLENLAGGVTTGVKKVTILGSTSSAATAANSAFSKSSLVAAGWTVEVVPVASFATFFGAGGNLNTGILMMDSGGNVGGGVAGTAFNPYAGAINTFLGAGGALFSQANGYSWLSTLIPGLTDVDESNTGLALTADGSAAFPGLTNADLSAGPWHNSFTNIGSLSVFATSSSAGSTFGHFVIIGSAGGSITNPEPPRGTPEPGSLALMGIALAGLAAARRRKIR